MDLVVGEFVANGSHRIAKLTSPLLTRGPLDVRNDDKDNNILADLHAISLGFRGLRTKAFDIPLGDFALRRSQASSATARNFMMSKQDEASWTLL